MRGALFATLLLAACGGVLLSFRRSRTRAALAEDRFPTPGRRALAFFCLGGVLLLTVVFPFAGGFLQGETAEPERVSLLSLFGVHAILALFLVLYYVCSGRRSVVEFLRLRSVRPASDLAAGTAIGGGVWLFNFLLAAVLLGLRAIVTGGAPLGGAPVPPRVSPMVLLLVHQPIAVRVGIVVSAMVVEELFFRSFLQTRVGPVASTLMFTAAHASYGQPLLLVWILVVSTALSLALALYRNVLPCIIAHGVFDSIQMFIVIPFVLKALAS